jgi:hypothetical protein
VSPSVPTTALVTMIDSFATLRPMFRARCRYPN